MENVWNKKIQGTKTDFYCDLKKTFFVIAGNLLKSCDLNIEMKLRLLENILRDVDEEVHGESISKLTTNLVNEVREIPKVKKDDKLVIKITSKIYLDVLVKALPNSVAEFLLLHSRFETDLIAFITDESLKIPASFLFTLRFP